MSYIVADQLTKTYGPTDTGVTALDGVSFQIQAGEFVAVMGDSGSGKSTLLSILGAMNAPSAGALCVDEIDVYALPIERQADFRREFLGFVFQHFHLVPYLTVLENVMLPLVTIALRNRKKQEMAREALTWVGLAEKTSRLPSEISGGEKERVALARAIVNNPPVLLADEPTGSLDDESAAIIFQLLNTFYSRGATVVVATHDKSLIKSATGRVLQIRQGRLDTPPDI